MTRSPPLLQATLPLQADRDDCGWRRQSEPVPADICLQSCARALEEAAKSTTAAAINLSTTTIRLEARQRDNARGLVDESAQHRHLVRQKYFCEFPRSSQREFGEDLRTEFSSKLLILLVGAAGFEPTTCSTQNCRATRLRYTPIVQERLRYTLKAPAARCTNR
jgi:hypothetical protein